MAIICKTNQVVSIDFSKIFTENEHVVGTIGELGLPLLVHTNKAIYKLVVGKGTIEGMGEKYDTYNQITKEFDFSEMYPIYENTWKIVALRSETPLRILTYQMMMEFNSVLHINNYFFQQWQDIVREVKENMKAYETSSAILPPIPLLKELIDGFFVECKDLISHILTLFKLYYLKRKIEERGNPTESKCLEKVKEPEFFSTNRGELIRLFRMLGEIGQTLRAIRNALSHPENYADNSFSLYNVHWENNKTLCSPIIEYRTTYKKKNYQGQIQVLEYTSSTYDSLLTICGSFLNILVQDLNSENKKR